MQVPVEPQAPRRSYAKSTARLVGKVLTGVIAGLLPAILGMALVMHLSASPEVGGTGFFVFLGLAFLLSIFSSRVAKAWRRIFLLSALIALAMPLSTVVYTGHAVNEQMKIGGDNAVFGAAGAVIGGGLLTLITGFLGFFLGAVFLIIGLLIGRDKQVIIVHGNVAVHDR